VQHSIQRSSESCGRWKGVKRSWKEGDPASTEQAKIWKLEASLPRPSLNVLEPSEEGDGSDEEDANENNRV
jgi:hypothetical protein